jgi:type I site-specific restriction endonuclease
MESERLTRKRRIDPQLKSLGWQVVPYSEGCSLTELNNCAIEEFPTENGPADYALCLDGRIIGVLEAKKLTLGPQNVLTQALKSELFQRPILDIERSAQDGFNKEDLSEISLPIAPEREQRRIVAIWRGC